VLWRKCHKRHAKNRIGTRRKNLDFVAAVLVPRKEMIDFVLGFLRIQDLERHKRAHRFPDPVFLCILQRLRPVDVF
jgi:hypothetical protein